MANEERNELLPEEEQNIEPEVAEPVVVSDEEPEEDTVEDFKTPFQAKIAAMSESRWKTVQYIVGALMGIIVVAFLGGGSEQGSNMSFTIYAAAIALILPNILQKTCDRSVMAGKMAMLVAIAVGVVLQLVLHLAGVL